MMLISSQGTAVRTRVEEVGVQGRNTQGVRVIRTREGEALVSVSRIAEDDIDTSDPDTMSSEDVSADGAVVDSGAQGAAVAEDAAVEGDEDTNE
jgi:DNA gyrase subunit A